MLFRDKLKDLGERLQPEFESLFQKVIENQGHSGDLLLTVINGFYDEQIGGTPLSGGRIASPYLVGPGSSGHSDNTHYQFIHEYRRKVSEWEYPEYLELHKYTPERKVEIDTLLDAEYISIHLEALIYLKIWEGDHFIKVYYQFVRVLNGLPYDWHFKIKSSNRDYGTGTRQNLIRLEIRDKIKDFSEETYKIFKLAYLTQVRNAIAHSNFSFQGRNMHLHNKVEGDPSHQLVNLEFDKWVDMFHSTVMLHNFYIWLKNRINDYYGYIFLNEGKPIELRIVKPDGTESFTYVEYREEFKDWKFVR